MKYMTGQRKALMDFFTSHPHRIVSAKELKELLDDEKLSISAVYRNLSQLEKEGVVRRCTQPGSREAYFQYIMAEACREHIHLTCKKCGKTVHMEHEDSEMLILRAHKYKNFLVDKSETVLYGVCEACQHC